MPAFVAGNKENAKRPKRVGEWCDRDYFDGLRDPRGYLNQKYDHRKGYGLTFWDDRLLEQARDMIKIYHIHRFLELGCAKGFRVQAMRMQGVEAWGIDISYYATANCHPDLKDYILCQDATDLSRFEDSYFDFIHAWDFLEHLLPDEIKKCLKECKRVGTRWLEYGVSVFNKDYESIAVAFPYEPQDPTHVSCYTIEWWRKLFDSLFDKEEIVRWEVGKTGGRRYQLHVQIKLREDADG